MSIVIQQPGAARSLRFGRGAPAAGCAWLPDGDTWFDALAKLIPGEMIVAFHAALRMPGVGGAWSGHLAVVVVLTGMIPLVLWSSTRRAGIRAHWLQYVVRSATFVLYGVGGDPVLLQRLGLLQGTLQVGDDPVLLQRLGPLQGILQVGALLVPTLAALALCPPGAQRPPPDAHGP